VPTVGLPDIEQTWPEIVADLTDQGWSRRQVQDLLDRYHDTTPITAAALIRVAGCILAATPGLPACQVHAWLDVLFSPPAAGAVSGWDVSAAWRTWLRAADTPAPMHEIDLDWVANEYQQDAAEPMLDTVLPAHAYVAAAGGDHEAARLALAAGLTPSELAGHVTAGTLDPDSLRVLAGLSLT